ncbi:MFS transporter [Enterococcus faecalis]|uniref:MFS transporter n=1 Tax=Enterococcus faecalis TaxID=1351 RepID=UPI00226F2094
MPLFHLIVTWIGTLVLSTVYLSAVGILEDTAERFSRVIVFSCGYSRAWESFGYALSILLASFLFVKNPNLNFWDWSMVGVILLLNRNPKKNVKQY